MNILNNLKYEIKYKNVKNINMRLKKDGVLVISAPHGVSKREIEDLVKKHYNRFYKAQVEIFEKNKKMNISVDSRNHIYLKGNRFDFEAVKDTKFSYSITSNKVTLYYRNIEKDYEKMVREIASKVFNELSKVVSSEMGLNYIEVENKKFSRCFGKNYNKTSIALNYLLVHMDEEYIKHVLYHEYTHCLVFNHSKKFYEILGTYDKNYRENKKYISKNLHKYC